MSKSDYRVYFAYVSKFVKLTQFIDLAKISRSNFSKFLNDDDEYGNAYVSIEKLEKLHKIVEENLKKLIDSNYIIYIMRSSP